MTVPAVAGARGAPWRGSPRTSMVSPGSWARPDVAARSADGSRHHATRRDGGTELPSFARRGESTVAPPGRFPGSRVRSAPALHAVPPSPRDVPRVASWDWLPGYSGGTAPAFDRLPSRPPFRGHHGGGTAMSSAELLRPRIADNPQGPQRRVPLDSQPRPQPLHQCPHPLDPADLVQAREWLPVPPLDDQ